ncbi:MAG: hypothetical protein ABWX74_07405 [Aeromicrobium sp.]
MTVTVERNDGIAALTFSAPPANLHSLELHEEFDRALDEVVAELPTLAGGPRQGVRLHRRPLRRRDPRALERRHPGAPRRGLRRRGAGRRAIHPPPLRGRRRARATAHTTAIASELFDTEDLQGGMESFLRDDPGKATFHRR